MRRVDPADLPTSEVVYSILAKALERALGPEGALRVSGLRYPAWRLDAGDSEAVFLSLQTDRKATDRYAGGGFRIELEKSRTPAPALGLTGRALFFQLLTASELQKVLAQQNGIISGLPRPPAEHIALYPEGPVRDMYLSYFNPQDSFGPVRSWLRYRTIEDVERWADTIAALTPVMAHRARDLLQRGVRHLGKGALI